MAPKGTPSPLRNAIRSEIKNCYEQKKAINKKEIKAKYSKEHPKLAKNICDIVDGYAAQLESAAKSKTPIKPSTTNNSSRCSQRERAPPSNPNTSLKRDTLPSLRSSSQDIASPAISQAAGYEFNNGAKSNLEDANATAISKNTDNILFQEFKEHLAGSTKKDIAQSLPADVPSLEAQRQFFRSRAGQDYDQPDEPLNGHAALISPLLKSCIDHQPSQLALLGKILAETNAPPDPRIMLNTNIPFSAFICGVQGSGKSHTTNCIIENCSMEMTALGNLRRSVSTLVLHFNEYSSTISSYPSETAFLASVMPQHGNQQPINVRVLVSATNFHSLKKMYGQIPNVEVRPFKIQPRHLNISTMLSLMSISQNDSMPLYMAQVTRILREMATKSGGHFDYSDFRARLKSLNLNRTQTPFLHQRLDLLDSYLDHDEKNTSDYFVDGGVTILDLSCPFLDHSTACILFRITIDLFLCAHPTRGKMVVADEAHKYMTDTPGAKELTKTFLNIIRQQRHLGVRTVICTQEPTISPKLIDLCSITIMHRFSSPEWYKTIQKHVPMNCESSCGNVDDTSDGLYRIASLRTGEAIVFAPSARLAGEDGALLDVKHSTFRMRIRNRVTWDGGRTILCIR